MSIPTNTIQQENNTGSVGRNTYNHRVGKIGVARGGRQGNTALIDWSSVRVLLCFHKSQCFSYEIILVVFLAILPPQSDPTDGPTNNPEWTVPLAESENLDKAVLDLVR